MDLLVKKYRNGENELAAKLIFQRNRQWFIPQDHVKWGFGNDPKNDKTTKWV
jgi:hypothetical protein